MDRDTAEELYQFVKKTPHADNEFETCAKQHDGPCTCGKTQAEDVLYRFATTK